MDLARAGNLFHQDSEVSEVTRLLQSSREWKKIIWWHSLKDHFHSWHLQAAKISPPTTETSVVEMLELGNLAKTDVSVLEIERSTATDGWHLRLKDRIRTGVNQSELLESRIAVETSPCAWISLEGTYVLNMESCLQHSPAGDQKESEIQGQSWRLCECPSYRKVFNMSLVWGAMICHDGVPQILQLSKKTIQNVIHIQFQSIPMIGGIGHPCGRVDDPSILAWAQLPQCPVCIVLRGWSRPCCKLRCLPARSVPGVVNIQDLHRSTDLLDAILDKILKKNRNI